MNMPIINLDNLDDQEKAIAEKIIGRGGKLRSSTPSDGEAAYVWRMVAFMVSPKPQHHCIPVSHDFGVMDIAPKIKKFCKYMNREIEQTDFDWVRNHCKKLDIIVDKIVDNVKVQNRHGVNRWAKAFYG
jgi:hypothetical protein